MDLLVDLGLQHLSNLELLSDGNKYTTAITGNAHFLAAGIVAQNTATKGALQAFQDAMDAPYSLDKNDLIKAARKVAERDITKLANQVEGVANDPAVPDDQREGIVHSAAMRVKSQTKRDKQHFEVKHGELPNSIDLIAQGRANAHEWTYTPDLVNFSGRIHADVTTEAHITILNLIKGQDLAIFHRPVTPGGPNPWEGPIFITVI